MNTNKIRAATVCVWSRLGSLIAAAAIAVGTMMTLTAPDADAMPAREIESGCKQAGGSFWRTYDPEFGFTGYICQYKSIAGTVYRDLYNGTGDYGATCKYAGGKYSDCYN
jgi:hypothetical protein